MSMLPCNRDKGIMVIQFGATVKVSVQCCSQLSEADRPPACEAATLRLLALLVASLCPRAQALPFARSPKAAEGARIRRLDVGVFVGGSEGTLTFTWA